MERAGFMKGGGAYVRFDAGVGPNVNRQVCLLTEAFAAVPYVAFIPLLGVLAEVLVARTACGARNGFGLLRRWSACCDG